MAKFNLIILCSLLLVKIACGQEMVLPINEQIAGYTFNLNGTYSLVTTVHDVGGKDISVGTYQMIGNTIFLSRNYKQFVSENTDLKLSDCEARSVKVVFTDFTRMEGEDEFHDLQLFDAKLYGKTCSGLTILLDQMNSCGREQEKYIFDVLLDGDICLNEIWVDHYGLILGTLKIPENFDCLEVNFPLIDLFPNRINPPNMWVHKIEEIVISEIGIKKYKVEYFKDGKLLSTVKQPKE